MSNKHEDGWKVSLAALGVVFGDIGTSPLYALRECFNHGLQVNPGNVLGVLSLIVWALIMVVSIKYLVLVMRADNKGEGGIAALVALLNPWKSEAGSSRYILMLLGLFGAALLFGDGAITSAISVLSAVEGLELATPTFTPYVIPITLVLLTGLFWIQKKGTGKIGMFFGPIMTIWFLVLAGLGINGILKAPEVLQAVNPSHAIRFLLEHGKVGFIVMGSVFLVTTGGEALYADMGHFGLKPIRKVWFILVLPALLLNYFGQAALYLTATTPETDPFYHLAPSWALYPMIGLAGMATIIASQAMISGVFSLMRQLVQLGQLPRLKVVQTSSDEQGQVYLPFINWILMITTILLVLSFKSSSALASAYGIAVSTTMVITTILAFFVARRFHWNMWFVAAITLPLIIIDITFFVANLFKFFDGGWVPVTIAVFLFTLMTTWSRGRKLLVQRWGSVSYPTNELVDFIETAQPHTIPGTAVFFTPTGKVPPYMLRHLKRHPVLQNKILLLRVTTIDEPYISDADRIKFEVVTERITRLTLRYGFMQQPNVPSAIKMYAAEHDLSLDVRNMSYYLGRETVIPSREIKGMALWRDYIFALMSRNATMATAYYHVPPNDVVELGFQLKI